MIIPAGRCTVWNPGFALSDLNIVINDTLEPAGGDNSVQLNAALTAAALVASPSNIQKVALAPSASGWHFTGQVFVPSCCCFGGITNNPRDTKYFFDTSDRFPITIGEETMGFKNWLAVVSGYTLGSTQLVFASAGAITSAGYEVGDHFILTQKSDQALNEDSVGQLGASLLISDTTNPGQPWPGFVASMGQVCEIEAITGDTITVKGRIHYTFLASCDPHIAHTKPTSRSKILPRFQGVENLYIERTVGNSFNTSYMIGVFESAYPWVRNVEVNKGVGRMIRVAGAYRPVIQNAFIHHAWQYTSGALSYLFGLSYYTTDALIEDSAFWFGNAGIVVEACGPGNVVRYCFMQANWLDEGNKFTQLGSVQGHQGTSFELLIEGCQGVKVLSDNVHGNAVRWTTALCDLSGTTEFWPQGHPYYDISARRGLHMESESRKFNAVGNVLCDYPQFEPDGYNLATGEGDPGADFTDMWCMSTDAGASELYDHGNYNGWSDEVRWDAGNADHDIPDSFSGLTEAPDYWPPGVRWPPIKSTLSPRVVDIPAKTRFLAVLAQSPVELTAPALSGVPQVGDTQTTSVGSVDAFPATQPTIQWFECPGLTEAPLNTAIPTISGIAKVGQTLTGTLGTWNPGIPQATYQHAWLDCDESGDNCSLISGESELTYVPDITKLGRTIRKRTTATNASAPSGVIADSDATAVVEAAAEFIVATGGTITTDGDFKVHSFTANGTFEITDGVGDVEYLVIGGGGSGGYGFDSQNCGGGGGGAGGFRTGTKADVGSGSYTVTVGGSDQNSVFDDITSLAGGVGGARFQVPAAGGSGGGGEVFHFPGGAGTAGQGNNGGTVGGSHTSAAGGGGAGAVAESPPSNNDGGTGGAGLASSITGSPITYAGGGAGGGNGSGLPGVGGSGGGGDAGLGDTPGEAGAANTGSGGGGGGGDLNATTNSGGAGGSGIVIVRYQFQA